MAELTLDTLIDNIQSTDDATRAAARDNAAETFTLTLSAPTGAALKTWPVPVDGVPALAADAAAACRAACSSQFWVNVVWFTSLKNGFFLLGMVSWGVGSFGCCEIDVDVEIML